MQCLKRNDGPLAGAAIVVSSDVILQFAQGLTGLALRWHIRCQRVGLKLRDGGRA